MALETATVWFDLHQLLGGDFDPRRTKAYVTTNVENGTLIDTETGEIRMGDQTVTINSDGTGDFDTWRPGEEGNPTSWQTSLVVDYARTGQRDRVRRTFGPYTIDATNRVVTNKALTSNVATLTVSAAHGLRVGDTVFIEDVDATFDSAVDVYETITAVPSPTSLSYARTASNVASTAATGAIGSPYVSLALLEDEQAIPPNYQTAFTDSMEAIRDEAEAARDAAVDISNISIDDDIVEALVKNTGGAGPKTSAALTASTADGIADDADPRAEAVDDRIDARAVVQGAQVFDVRHYASAGVSVGTSAGSSAADDTAAAVAALAAAFAFTSAFGGRHQHVHFPAGEWYIDADALFSTIGATFQQGLRISGAGKESTRIHLVTHGSARWLYDNGASSVLNMVTFEHIGFYSDSRDYGNGFKLTGNAGGHEQGFTFLSCRFKGEWNTIFKVTGTQGTDSIRWYDCEFQNVYGAVLEQDNQQGVLIEYHGCNFTLIYGDFCKVDSGGGGDVKIFGGSMIFDQAAGDTTPHWMWNVTESSNVSVIGSGRFVAHGVRFEWRDAYHGFVNALAPSAQGSAEFTFNDCEASIVSGGGSTTRDMVKIGVQRRVHFNRCSMPSQATYVIDSNASFATSRLDTQLVWDNCVVPEALSDAVTFVTNFGRASARNCRVNNNVAGNRQAVDFDMGWRYSPLGAAHFPTKRAIILRADQGMPTNGGTERTILLPKDAKIVGIYIRRPATGSSTTAYQIVVGNDDKTVTHASSTSAAGQFKDAHLIAVGPHSTTPFYYDCGSSTTNRTLRIWSTGGDATLIQPTYAWVEYI